MKSKFPLDLLHPALLAFFAFGAFASQQYHTVLLEMTMHFSAGSIGNLLMLASFVNMVSPFVIILAEKKIPNTNIILSFLIALSSSMLFVLPHLTNPLLVSLCYTLMMIGINSSFPLLISNLVTSSQHRGESSFLALRSIGTLGFALSSVFAAKLSSVYPITSVYMLFACSGFLSFILSIRNIQKKPDRPVNKPVHSPIQLKEILKTLFSGSTRSILLLIAANHLAAFAAITYLGNFIHHELHGGNAQISVAWSIATFAEIPLIWISVWALKKFGLKFVLMSGLFANTLRLFLTWLTFDISPFYLIQILHGAFYGATMPAWAIYLNRNYGKEKLHGLLLFSGIISGGLAMALAGKFGGVIWETLGLRPLYLISGIICLVTVVLFTRVKVSVKNDA